MKKEKKIELKGALKALGVIVLLGMVCVGSAMGYATISADDFHWSAGDVVFNSTGFFINSTNVVDINAGQAATFIVAASDSLHPERADYLCPGVDDQVVIQAAINALLNGGGKVLLLEGNYNLSDWIVARSGTVLEGMGYNTYLQGGSIKIHNGYHSIIIKNLRINSELNSGHTINIDFCSNIVVENCFVYGGKDDAISVTANNGDTTNVAIRYNYVNKSVNDFEASGGPSGIEVGDDAERVTIEGNYVTGSVAGGVITGIKCNSHEYSDPPEDVKIINNIIENVDGPGITAGIWGGTISGNILLNVSTNGTGGPGLLLAGRDIICDRNVVKNSGEEGIFVNSINTIVSNCIIIDSERDGIIIKKDHVIIENCYIQGSKGAAITVEESSHVRISRCTLKNSYGHWDSCGVWMNGDYIEIINNHIYDDQTPKTQLYAIGTISVISNITIAFNELGENKNGPFNIFSPGSITNLEFFRNIGYITKNSGTSTGTGAQQTIAHGLANTPTKVILWNIEDGANPYQNASADATNIYILAVINQDYGWEVEVV